MTWQPISTAPKNGAHILVCSTNNPSTPPTTVHWFDSRLYGARSGGAGWHLSVNLKGEDSDYVWGPPTHWMPLPEPPKE